MSLNMTALSTQNPMQNPQVQVHVAPVGPLQCNCTIIHHTLTQEAIIIDAGGDADALLAWLKERQLKLLAVYHTHAHFDHFLASEALRQATGCALYLHEADLPLWAMLDLQCERFGMPKPPHPTHPPDGCIEDEQPLVLEGLGTHQTLFTPGHTPGSCCFHLEEQGILIAGDTLFRGGIGRTDLWGGSFEAIQKSITQRLFTLEGETLVVTGHGRLTQIHQERRAFQ